MKFKNKFRNSRYQKIKKRVNFHNSLSEVVRRYTAHMQVKFALPEYQFRENYVKNYRRALNDEDFRNYLFDDY